MNKIFIIFSYLILFLIATEGLFTNYQIAGIGISRIIEILFFLLIFKSFQIEVNNNSVVKYTLILTIFLFLFLAMKLFTVTFISNDFTTEMLIEMVRLIIIFIYIFIIYYIMLINNKSLHLILIINFPIMLIAFFQSQITPFTDIAWDLKFNYFPSKFEDTQWFRTRVSGLYSYSIELSYILVSNMFISLYLYIKSKKNIFLFYFLFIGVISLFSLTRSVILSWIIMMTFIILVNFKLGSYLKKIVSIILIVLGLFSASLLLLNNSSNFDRITNKDDTSAEARIPLAITALNAIISYPLGISDNNYQEIKEQMAIEFNNYHVVEVPSHNGFLNIGIKYTLFGLIFFSLYIFLINKLFSKTLSKEMNLFFKFSIFAYLANSLFHNNFIFLQDFYGSIIIAIFMYEFKQQKDIL